MTKLAILLVDYLEGYINFTVACEFLQPGEMKTFTIHDANLYESPLGVQVKFPVQKGQLVGSAPQLKLVAPPGMREVFDVDDVKLPVWPEHMSVTPL